MAKCHVEETYTSSFVAFVSNRTADSKNSYNSSKIDNDDLDASVDLAYTYAKLLKSSEIIEEALESTGLSEKYDYSDIASEITTKNEEKTQFVTFSIKKDTAEEAYEIAKAVAEEAPAQMAEIVEGSSMRVVTKPAIPKAKVSSSTKSNAMKGFLLGAFLMIVIIVIKYLMDPKIRNKEEIVRKFDLPIIGVIPGTPAVINELVSQRGADGILEIARNAEEAYKVLRTNIAYALPGNDCKVIGITSALYSDGKNVNALSCAESFGQLGKKVLFIDADLRHPSCASELSVSNTPGLCDILTGQMKIDNALQSPDGCKITLLPAGNVAPDPTALLQSEQMEDLLKSVREQYDYIFIDMPPVLEAADASILSGKTDGFMVVVRDKITEYRAVSEMLKQLAIVGTKIIGVIYTDIKPEGRKRHKR